MLIFILSVLTANSGDNNQRANTTHPITDTDVFREQSEEYTSQNRTFVSVQDIQDASTSSGMGFYDPQSENSGYQQDISAESARYSPDMCSEIQINAHRTGVTPRLNRRTSPIRVYDQSVEFQDTYTPVQEYVEIEGVTKTNIKESLEYAAIKMIFERYESELRQKVQELAFSEVFLQKSDSCLEYSEEYTGIREKLKDPNQLTALRNIVTAEIQSKIDDMINSLAEIQMFEDDRPKALIYLEAFENSLYDSLNSIISARDPRWASFGSKLRKLHKEMLNLLAHPLFTEDSAKNILDEIMKTFHKQIKKREDN